MTISTLARSFYNMRSRPVVANTLGTLLIRGTTAGTRLVVSFIIAHAVSPSAFGVIAFVLAGTEIVKSIVDLGIDTFAVREIATIYSKDEQSRFLEKIAFIKLVSGMLGYSIFAGILFVLYHNSFEFYIGILIGVLIFTALGTNLAIDYFQARLRMSAIVLPIVVVNFCSILVLYGLVLLHAHPVVLIAILPFSETISAFILLVILRQETQMVFGRLSWQAMLEILRHSAPIAGTTIFVIVYTRLDVLFLNLFANSADVGYYSVAYRLTEPFQLVAASFGISIYSHLSQIYTLHPERINHKAMRYAGIMFIYALCSCVLLISVAPYFITIYLPAYIPSIHILRVLAFGLIVRNLNACLTAVIQARGQFLYITVIAFGNMFVIIGLLLVLLPLYGAIGAAIALLLGEVVNSIIQFSVLFGKR
jgi:O-antigen/teichoic acid export membrane protein